MFAVKQYYNNYREGISLVREVGRYKTRRGAEKRAGQCRYECRPEGRNGPITEESSAEIVEVAN